MSTALAPAAWETFHKYAGLALPRHVAYPMPTWWTDLTATDADELRRASRHRTPAPDLSLYVHVPFCERLCRYCACTRIVQSKRQPAAAARTAEYVAALECELERLPASLGPRPRLRIG